MKKTILYLLFNFFFLSSFGQGKFIGIDLGYQLGKNQFFETGINYTMFSETLGSSFSIGLEDNVNSKDFGYKVGLSGFSRKKFPLYLGVDLTKNIVDNNDYYSLRPEIGFGGIVNHFGRGISVIRITYGYNFALKETNSKLNTHLMRFSINTNLMGLIDVIGIGAYKLVCIFVPNCQ